MIVRSYFECDTCGHHHTVRIGVGHEAYQTHRIRCVGCNEEMVVALRAQPERHIALPEAVENAILHKKETVGASIVNVHANFTIPEDQRHVDKAFPHLKQMHDQMEAAELRGSLVDFAKIDAKRVGTRPFRPPDYAGEWKLLKKAWNLHRNGKEKLSRRQVELGSSQFYANDSLDGLEDWVWRFSLFFGQPKNELLFEPAFKELKNIAREPRFRTLMQFYESDMAEERARRYFEIAKAFFEGYDEFSQVTFQVWADLPVPPGHRASSADFDAVKMFYGNAFEALSSSVDLLAYANNIVAGREYDTFSKLTKAEYLALDKASRFNAYALNAPFTALSAGADNQIRNASHHGSFHFDPDTQIISYRSGKGGTGPEQTMTFVEYLAKCVTIFTQLMVMLRIEILLCHIKGVKKPI